jgi:hypothetical protein
MVPKKVEFVIDDEQLKALDAILKPGVPDDDRALLFMKVLPLLMTLNAAYTDGATLANEHVKKTMGDKLTPEEENIILKSIIDRLEWRVRGLIVRDMLNQQMSSLHGEKMAGVVADLALIPETVKVHCTEDGHGYDYTLTIRDIIAIKSIGRIKRIYIRNNVAGGDFVKYVEANIGFEDLLEQLQKKALLLQIANRSSVFNMLEYKFLAPDTFTINSELGKKLKDIPAFEPILTVVVDSKFNKEQYESSRWEIDHYVNHVRNMETADAKLKILSRYKNSLPVS